MEFVPSHGVMVRPATCRILIANFQPIVRHGLRALLAAEPYFEVVGETGTGIDAVRLARELRRDVIVIDLLMPRLDGLAATRRIRAELPETQVIVMSGVDDDTSAIESIRTGAAGYLLKDARIDALLRAIRCAAMGQMALPVQAARQAGGGRTPRPTLEQSAASKR
jgi:DNA-binding NarL/FixJ family response regulator